MAQRQSSGSLIARTAVITIIGLALLLGGAEIFARSYVSSQITKGFETDVPALAGREEYAPDVSFGTSPLILGLLSQRINHLTVDIPSSLELGNGGLPATTATIDGLGAIDTADPTVEAMTVTTTLPKDYLLAQIQQQVTQALPSGLAMFSSILNVTNLTLDPSHNAIELELAAGVANVTLVPDASGEQLVFRADDPRLFGIGLPAEAADYISTSVRDAMTQSDAGLTLTGITVNPTTVEAKLTGNNVALSQALPAE